MSEDNAMNLKPCPQCGGNAIMETFRVKQENHQRFRVRCLDCNWDNGWMWFSERDAAYSWNRRTD